MKLSLMYTLETPEEIKRHLGYDLICCSIGSSLWDTGKVKRPFMQNFTPEERKQVGQIYRKARTWYLVKGLPEKVELFEDEYKLWQKLRDFCAKYCTAYGVG